MANKLPTPKKSEKRSTYLNRCDDRLAAARVWRLSNATEMRLPENDGLRGLFPLRVLNEGGRVQLFITDVIGDPQDSQSFVEALEANPTAPVDVEINSPGGSVNEAMRIFNALVSHEGSTTGRITGEAASSGLLISQGVDNLVINETAAMMMHPVSTMIFAVHNDPQQARDDGEFIAELLEKGNERIIDLLSVRSGQSRKKVEGMVFAKGGNGTTLTGKEAVDLGFADELVALKPRKTATAAIFVEAALAAYRDKELALCNIRRRRLALTNSSPAG